MTLTTKQSKAIYGGGRDHDDGEVVTRTAVINEILATASKAAPKRAAPDIERRRMEKWLNDKIAGGRSTEIVTITPVLAQLLLERNTKNRPIASPPSRGRGSKREPDDAAPRVLGSPPSAGRGSKLNYCHH
jgi:hypothetical protein